MSLPSIIVTGASGFLGRSLLESLKDDFHVYGLARRITGPLRSPGPPQHQVVPGRHRRHRAAARRLPPHPAEGRRRHGHPPRCPLRLHRRGAPGVPSGPTSMDTAICSSAARSIRIRNLVFSSSVAASSFRRAAWCWTRRAHRWRAHLRADQGGRRGMLSGVQRSFPVRDHAIRRAVLGLVRVPAAVLLPEHVAVEGVEPKGARRAGPLGHSGTCTCATCLPSLRRILDRWNDLDQGEVLIAGPDGVVSHLELFEAATTLSTGPASAPAVHAAGSCAAGCACSTCAPGRLWGAPVRAALDGAVHRSLSLTINSERTRAAGSAGRRAAGWRSSAGFRSSWRTGRPTRSNGTVATARR